MQVDGPGYDYKLGMFFYYSAPLELIVFKGLLQ